MNRENGMGSTAPGGSENIAPQSFMDYIKQGRDKVYAIEKVVVAATRDAETAKRNYLNDMRGALALKKVRITGRSSYAEMMTQDSKEYFSCNEDFDRVEALVTFVTFDTDRYVDNCDLAVYASIPGRGSYIFHVAHLSEFELVEEPNLAPEPSQVAQHTT